MSVTYLNSPIQKFTHLIHVADIHIRLTKRHDEYREVFQEFYDAVDKSPPETLIAVLGDVFHVKSDLSPECVKLAGDFLKTLANKRPTILIAGNHDATLNNKNRMDSLTPIVEQINHPNLYYLRDSGIFVMGNVLLNHFSVFDDYTKYIHFDSIPKKVINATDYKIALFHGPVLGAMTDVGYRVVSKTVGNDSFDGHDIVLLGDIHRHQMLQEHSINYNKPVIVYAGSMIQQNHGELLDGHGYVLWDLKNKDYEMIELKNDYGFFTVEIDKGKLFTDVTDMPKKVSLRAKCNQTIPSEVRALMAKLSDKHQLIEIVYDKVDSEKELHKKIIDTSKINLTSISSNVDYQNQLIKEFLLEKKKEIVTDELMEQIFNINRDVNNKIEKELIVRNLRWKPKKFEFENMFSYGEGNVIDFSTMKGVIGVFAKNSSGKSSILNALSYCLFDKCETTFKASEVLNIQKMSFNCKFNFEIDGNDFFIERIGVQDKKGNVKVEVKFYTKENGKDKNLNGDARRSTNDVIRDYIGTYDDFLLTVLSVQNGKADNFISMGQANRKDLIANFLGITIYDQLDTIAKNDNKEIVTLLKNYSRGEYPELLAQRIQEISQLEKSIETESIELEKFENRLKIQNEKLISELSKIVNTNRGNLDINDLESKKRIMLTKKGELSTKIASINPLITQILTNISEIDTLLLGYDINKLKSDTMELSIASGKNQKYTFELEKKTYELNSKKDKIEQLKKHKFNPDCEDCVRLNTHSIQETSKLKNEIVILQNEHNSYKILLAETVSDMERLKYVVDANNKASQLIEQKRSLESKLNISKLEMLKCENELNQVLNKLGIIDVDIAAYHVDKENIESNKITNTNISVIKSAISQLEHTIKNINNTLAGFNGRKMVALTQKTSYEETIKTARTWEVQQMAYTYYLMAISRDGIPYNLITQALPAIENEINNTLHQIAEFTVKLNTDGKNVRGYINDNGYGWPIDLAAGFEKFALNLAIRVALINISNLPRPNFLAIDEGFGCADKENLSAMSSLLAHFKHSFEFVWVISHLDAMKDMVDTQLEIKKEKGLSKIVAI
jgi:DNA repair exonuclease SbcCD ATPase subunit